MMAIAMHVECNSTPAEQQCFKSTSAPPVRTMPFVLNAKVKTNIPSITMILIEYTSEYIDIIKKDKLAIFNRLWRCFQHNGYGLD